MNTRHRLPTGSSTRRHSPFTRRAIPRILASSVTALLALGIGDLAAQTFNWNVNGGGSWMTDTNWTPTIAGDYPKDAGDIANLTFNLTSAAPITLDAAVTLGALTLGDPTTAFFAYTLGDGAGGSLTFNNSGLAATLTENAGNGSDVISATVKTAGDLNIVDLNTTAARTFTLSGPLTSSATSGTQVVTFSQANANAAVVASGSMGDGTSGGKIAVTKTGSGVLSLRNTIGTTANTFTGDLTINAGSVRGEVTGAVSGTGVAVGANSFGAGKIVLNGGSFGVYNNGDGTAAAQTILYGNNVDLNANGSVDVFHNGTAAATNKTFQFGTLTVNGNFTYSQNGGNTDGIRFEGGVLLKGNATFQGTASKTTFLTLNGITEDATPRSVTFNLVGTAHTTTITGTSNYTGGTILNNGTLTGAAANAFGNIGTIAMAAGNLRLNNYAAAATVDVATNQTLNITGGTLSMATNATASFPLAAVNITGGSPSLNGAALTTAATGTIATLAAPLTISGNPTIGSVSSTNVSVTVGGLTTLNSNVTFNLTNTFRLTSISEDATPRKITKTGAGLFNLTGGTINWTGGLDILNASVQVSATGAAGIGLINVGDTTGTNGATLLAGATATVANDITVRSGSSGTMILGRDTATTAGTGTFSGLITLNKDTTIQNASTSTTAGASILDVTGRITGTGVKLTTSARVSATNQIIRILNGANDFGFVAPTPDAITIGGGVTIVPSDGALGAAGNGLTLTNASGVFRADGTFTMVRSITVNAAGALVDVTTGNELTLSAPNQIGGTAVFTKGNSGILTITGDNTTRTLGTNVNAGTLRISTSNNIGTASPLTLAGGILELRNDTGTLFTNNVALGASATINVNQSVAGIATGQTHTIGTLTMGAFTLTATNANDYSLTTGAVTETGATATITNNFTGLGMLTLPSIALSSAAAGTFTLGGTGATIVTGTISQPGGGALSLIKSGTGTATLTGTASYTGTTSINAGTLRVTSAAGIPAGSVGLGGGTIALLNDTATVWPYNFTLTGNSGINADRAIGGTGTALKHTIGTITLAGQTLTLSNGNDYSLDTGAVAVTAAATLTGNIGGSGTLTVPSIAVNNAAAQTLTLRGTGNTIITGGITQAGAGAYNLTKLDAGTVTINAASTLTGNVAVGNTTTTGGLLKVGAAGAIPNTAITVTSGTLDLNGFALNPTAITLGGGPTATAASLITNGATLTLGGNITYNTTAGFLGGSIIGNVDLGGATRTLTIADTTGLEPDLAITGAISDVAGGMIKVGAGSLSLAGSTANTYAGPTTLNQGLLLLNKTAGVNAIPGDINATSTAAGSNSLIKNLASHQMADSANLTFSGVSGNGGSNWDLNGFDEAVASITFANNQGAGSQVIQTGAGTLTVNGPITIGGTSTASTVSAIFAGITGNVIAGNLDLGGLTRTITVTSAGTTNGGALITANIAHGGLVKAGATSLLLTGTNTYAGGTEIQTGLVDVRSLGGLGTGGVNLNGGNLTLRQNGDGTTTPETLAFSNPLTVSANATLIVDRIGGTGTTKTLTVPSLAIGGQTLIVTANNSYGFGVVGTMNLGGSPIVNVTAGPFSVGGVTDGGGGFGLTKQGTGTLAINGASSFKNLTLTGGTVSGSGALTLTDDLTPLTLRNNTIANDLKFTGAAGAAIAFDATSNGTATLGGQVDLGTATRSFNIPDGTTTPDMNLTGILAGTGGWTKDGAGNLRLSGTSANSYGGTATLNTGSLALNKPAGVNAITGDLIMNGGTLNTLAADQIADTANITVNGGTFNFANGGNTTFNETVANFTLNGGLLRTSAGTPAVASLITITGTFTLANGDFAVNSGSSMTVGKFILNGGVNVVGGNTPVQVNVLTVGAGGFEFTGGQMKMNVGTIAGSQGSQIVLGGDVTSFASLAEAGIFGESAGGSIGTRSVDLGSGPRTFTVADGGAFNDLRIQYPLIGNGSLTKTGNGLLLLEAANTFAGNTQINAGTLTLGPGASVVSPVIEVAPGATFDVNSQFTGYTIAPTRVLRANGVIAGSVNVSGTLNGTGSVTGNVTVAAAGVLAPGASPGTLGIDGVLTFNDDSIFAVELGGALPGDGAGFYDQVNVTNLFGAVILGNNVALQTSLLGGYTPAPSDVFFILTRADTSDFGLPTFAGAGEGSTVNLGGGYTGLITYLADWTGTQAGSTLSGGNDVAIYAVVPEPGTALLLLGGLGCLVVRRRRGPDVKRVN